MPFSLLGPGGEPLAANAALFVATRETTKDGEFTVEAVMCLAACDKAPMFQLQNSDGIAYHENQSVESTLKLVEELRSR